MELNSANDSLRKAIAKELNYLPKQIAYTIICVARAHSAVGWTATITQ